MSSFCPVRFDAAFGAVRYVWRRNRPPEPMGASTSDTGSTPPKYRLAFLIAVLVFTLLAWAVWWYFEYKIQSLGGADVP